MAYIKDIEESFENKLVKAVKTTYSTDNNNLVNLSDFNTFLSFGYPEHLLQKREDILSFAFPIVYPFQNVELEGKTIADLGCGAGLDVSVASDLGARTVIALDLSFSFLNKINYKNVYPVNAYINRLPFKNPYFDIVVMNGSMNLIYDKISLLEQLNVIIKKEGLLIIGDFIWCGTEEERNIYSKDVDAWCWCTGGCLTEQELLFISEKNNFSLIEKNEFEKIETLKRMRYIFKNE